VQIRYLAKRSESRNEVGMYVVSDGFHKEIGPSYKRSTISGMKVGNFCRGKGVRNRMTCLLLCMVVSKRNRCGQCDEFVIAER